MLVRISHRGRAFIQAGAFSSQSQLYLSITKSDSFLAKRFNQGDLAVSFSRLNDQYENQTAPLLPKKDASDRQSVSASLQCTEAVSFDTGGSSLNIPKIIQAWLKAVCLPQSDSNRLNRLVGLYDGEVGSLTPTKSDDIRRSPEQIRVYFEGFTPQSAQIIEINTVAVGGFFVSSGKYEFGINGETVEARFTFVHTASKIIHQHSSAFVSPA